MIERSTWKSHGYTNIRGPSKRNCHHVDGSTVDGFIFKGRFLWGINALPRNNSKNVSRSMTYQGGITRLLYNCIDTPYPWNVPNMSHHYDTISNPTRFLCIGIIYVCIWYEYNMYCTNKGNPITADIRDPPVNFISTAGGIWIHWEKSEIRKVLINSWWWCYNI